jgi:hypothetical protein
LKEQLKLLIEVQKHDARIQELEGMMRVWPQKLESLREDLAKVEAMLARERSELEETESWRRNKETAMKDEEAQLVKAKQRSAQVKNIKEMMANERELQVTRKLAQEREEEVVKLGEAVESAKKAIAQHEADLEALRQHVAAEEAKAQVEIDKFKGEIAEVAKHRDEAATKVRPDVMKKYTTIRGRRGIALVPVKHGTCQGCNMNIPPQLFNLLQRGDSIELCASCHRIIFWDKLLEDPDGEAAEKPGQ